MSLIQEEGLWPSLLIQEASGSGGNPPVSDCCCPPYWFLVAIIRVDHLGHVTLSGDDAESPPRTWLYFYFNPPCCWADPTREVLRRRAPPGWAILKQMKKKNKAEMKQQCRSSTVVTKQHIRTL